MATYSRVGVNGWRQGDDSSAQARVGVGGWYQVVVTAVTHPTTGALSAQAATLAGTARHNVPLLSAATVTTITGTTATPRVTVTF